MATTVQINGVNYVPEGTERPRIGIGVTTRNRKALAEETVQCIRELTPGAVVVLVDDATEGERPESDYRFHEQAGIARAKNKCIELLMDEGVEHLFLFDDDTRPRHVKWFEKYINSPEPHLMYQFEDVKGSPLGDIKQTYRDVHHRGYTGVRGCMLYAHRSVIESVGGMDPIYGVWGYEHVDWSNRIHNAGLTSVRYGDVQSSYIDIRSMDEEGSVERSVPSEVRERLVAKNAAICNARKNSGFAGYVDYRGERNAVLTTLISGLQDPQRPNEPSQKATFNSIRKWYDSIGGAEAVVFRNEELDDEGSDWCSFVDCDTSMPIYFQRWMNAWQWLRANPSVKKVWITDGTDVEMLQKPWKHMQENTIYVGSEDQILGCPWMVDNHKALAFEPMFTEKRYEPLMNAGLIGGHREDVMDFIHRIIRLYFDQAAILFHGTESEDLGVGDMGAFNWAVYDYIEKHEGRKRISFGPHVNTRFKAYETNNHSWWKHK